MTYITGFIRSLLALIKKSESYCKLLGSGLIYFQFSRSNGDYILLILNRVFCRLTHTSRSQFEGELYFIV